MDTYLIEYLKSGRAWVLVGSGPSSEAGYPSWEQLATQALDAVRREGPGEAGDAIRKAIETRDFPRAFDDARRCLGGPRLLECLRKQFRPARGAQIHDLLARWPVEVYLTTNFDDEIQSSLARVGVAYTAYGNSADHLGHLTPDLKGAVVKLHGDLRTEEGLVLTSEQYASILSDQHWEYWRTRMKSVFQMSKLVVVGHSLTDPHIKHLLEAAKQGATVHQPICWLAPDVESAMAREYLERHRIRVISYPNQSGDHGALLRLLRQVSQFVPARASVGIKAQIAQVSASPLGSNAGAPAFFVFNKLALQDDYEEKRVEIALSTLEAAVPTLVVRTAFTLVEALEIAGWPKETLAAAQFVESIAKAGRARGLIEPCEGGYKVGPHAGNLALENQARFVQMRDRFKQSLVLRVRRGYPSLDAADCNLIAKDIEASLTGYFRQGGLTLATILFAGGSDAHQAGLPSSIVGFMSEAASRYDDLLRRQAFLDASLEAFTRAELAEKEYLGRVSQGFFAFHALGAFGDVATERLREAKRTVWLVDSHVQIPALALGAPLNHLFRETLRRLGGCGVRLFTTRTLFEETREHFWFAEKVINTAGERSLDVLQAASGETPYRKSNQFLQGFVQWTASGGSGEWGAYLFAAFGRRRMTAEDLEGALRNMGIEVIDLQVWPGFKQEDFRSRDELVERVADLRKRAFTGPVSADDLAEIRRKALPEAEAYLVVRNERTGAYNVIVERASNAWFISETAILNSLDQGARTTWQPEAFLRFASTLANCQAGPTAEAAFETLLWTVARSGVNMIPDESVKVVFGGIVDSAAITLEEQREVYNQTLLSRYGLPASSVLDSVPKHARPVAAVQLLRELLSSQAEAARRTSATLEGARKRAEKAEAELAQLGALKKKLRAKKERGRAKKRKQSERHKGKSRKGRARAKRKQ